MHQTRSETTTKLPIRRKGTKYIARALHSHRTAVPVVIAVREMLSLARTAKEVKEMVKDKIIQVNGRIVYDYREPVQLFNILSVGNKSYVLSISETAKFIFSETKDSKKRLCKIVGKKLINDNKLQVNLHDGTNFIGKKDMKTNDSVYLDNEGKVVKHIPIASAKEIMVMSGKYIGQHGNIKSIKGNSAEISFKEGSALLPLSNIIAL